MAKFISVELIESQNEVFTRAYMTPETDPIYLLLCARDCLAALLRLAPDLLSEEAFPEALRLTESQLQLIPLGFQLGNWTGEVKSTLANPPQGS